MDHGGEGLGRVIEEGQRQYVIVLCGLLGSGKSSFARALQEYYPDFVRCNQDILGSRKAVLSLASHSLAIGQSVIIDRTNVDESQRATWVDLAQTLPNVEVQAFVLQTSREICKARLALRTDHETIKDPNHALYVLERFHRDFTPPKYSEGFRKIINIYPEDFVTALPTKEEIDLILVRAEQAPVVDVPIVRTTVVPTHQTSRGGGRGGWRGNGQWQNRGGAASHSLPGRSDNRWRGDEPPRQEAGYDARPSSYQQQPPQHTYPSPAQ